MKRAITSLLILVLALNIGTPIALATNETSNTVSTINIDNMLCDEMDNLQVSKDEFKPTTRATARVEVEVGANSIIRGSTAFPLEEDELVTINCTFSPRTADVDFGLITPQNTFRYLPGKDGSFRESIQVNVSGKYYFAIRNNTGKTIEVLGYVYY